MADGYLAELRSRPKSPQAWRDRIAIWKRSHETEIDLIPFGADLTIPSLSMGSWNGLNIKPSVIGFGEKAVLGTATESERLSVTFELPTKPFFDDFALHTQQVVVSVHPLVTTENIVLKPPFFPPLVSNIVVLIARNIFVASFRIRVIRVSGTVSTPLHRDADELFLGIRLCMNDNTISSFQAFN
jgi:hypothetical protein